MSMNNEYGFLDEIDPDEVEFPRDRILTVVPASVGADKILELQGVHYVPLYVAKFNSVILSEAAMHTGIMCELYRISKNWYSAKIKNSNEFPDPYRSAELFIENAMGWYVSGAHGKIIVPRGLLGSSLLKAYTRKSGLKIDIDGMGYKEQKAMLF